jgi:hypothetical protein
MRTVRDAAFNSVLNALCTQMFCPVSANDHATRGIAGLSVNPDLPHFFPIESTPAPAPDRRPATRMETRCASVCV